jgi:hypothetical protein
MNSGPQHKMKHTLTGRGLGCTCHSLKTVFLQRQLWLLQQASPPIVRQTQLLFSCHLQQASIKLSINHVSILTESLADQTDSAIQQD